MNSINFLKYTYYTVSAGVHREHFYCEEKETEMKLYIVRENEMGKRRKRYSSASEEAL